MRFGARAVGSACYQIFSHLTLSFGGNVLAMLLSLPIVLVSIVVASFVHSLSVVPLGIAILVGALPNPACMGLQTLARGLALGDTPDFGEQWQGLRMYWRVSLRAWLLAAAVTITCALNMAFYAAQAANPATSLHAVAAPLFFVWALCCSSGSDFICMSLRCCSPRRRHACSSPTEMPPWSCCRGRLPA